MGKKVDTYPGSGFMPPGMAQDVYWSSHPTRDELQKTIEPISNALLGLLEDVHGNASEGKDGLITFLAKLDITIAFLMEKSGVSRQEFQEWNNKKMAEFQAIQARAQAQQDPSEVPKPIITEA